MEMEARAWGNEGGKRPFKFSYALVLVQFAPALGQVLDFGGKPIIHRKREKHGD
jgi:hypothetical protein